MLHFVIYVKVLHTRNFKIIPNIRVSCTEFFTKMFWYSHLKKIEIETHITFHFHHGIPELNLRHQKPSRNTCKMRKSHLFNKNPCYTSRVPYLAASTANTCYLTHRCATYVAHLCIRWHLLIFPLNSNFIEKGSFVISLNI